MTKRQMVELMVDAAFEADVLCVGIPGAPTYDMVFEKVLEAQIKAGMLPPEVIEKSVMPGVSDFKTNKWESEDV